MAQGAQRNTPVSWFIVKEIIKDASEPLDEEMHRARPVGRGVQLWLPPVPPCIIVRGLPCPEAYPNSVLLGLHRGFIM
jgi:hypothetical protein